MEMPLHALILSALISSIVHTATGPDHYLPFIALGKSRQWTVLRTAFITVIAGVIHVLGTIALGMVILTLAMEANALDWLTEFRGGFAAWSLLVFGIGYTIWGIIHGGHHHGKNSKGHSHGSNAFTRRLARFIQGRVNPEKANTIISVVVFLIFAFGPVEPLIPLLMVPSSAYGLGAAFMVSLVFMAGTIATMLVLVLGSLHGLKFVPQIFQNHGHSLAGATLALSGFAMVLGW